MRARNAPNRILNADLVAIGIAIGVILALAWRVFQWLV
jgi:hypothetical protein